MLIQHNSSQSSRKIFLKKNFHPREVTVLIGADNNNGSDYNSSKQKHIINYLKVGINNKN